MPTIGNNQFPYPNTSDEPNIPGDLQKLALAVDTAIGGGNRLIDTLATLQAIPNTQLFKGMRATVTNDPTTMNNGEYVYTGGAWVSKTRTLTATFHSQDNGNFVFSGAARLIVHPDEGWIEPDLPGVRYNITMNSPFPVFQPDTTIKPSAAIDLGRLFIVQGQFEKTLTWNTDGSVSLNNAVSGDQLFPVYRRIPIPSGTTIA